MEYIARDQGAETLLARETYRAPAGRRVNVPHRDFDHCKKEPGQDMTILVAADGKGTKKIYYTRLFYDRVTSVSYTHLVKRKEVAGKIKEAREQGDLSENAEYDAAKDEQRDIEARIEELEGILKNAEVVVEDEVDYDKINVGCTVKVFDVTFDEEMEFKIVGSTEANSLEGKISNESPVGQALIGKSVGDVVDVETQAGDIQYKVLEISRSA